MDQKNTINTTDIWRQYHNKLASFIASRVAPDIVEDLLQEVFIKVHRNIDSLQAEERLESWLYRITRNTIVDYYRAHRPTQALPPWLEQAQSTESDNLRKELASCLEPMINNLPKKYRRAVRLSELENVTQQQVAEREGISLSGAKSRVQRGRKHLKNMLQTCCRIELNHKGELLSFEKKDQNCKYC